MANAANKTQVAATIAIVSAQLVGDARVGSGDRSFGGVANDAGNSAGELLSTRYGRKAGQQTEQGAR